MAIDQQQLEESGRNWSQLLAKVWIDDDFKARFMREPAAVMEEHGIDVPEGYEIRTVEDRPGLFHVILPQRPTGELEDEDLEVVAGGGSTAGTASSAGTLSTASCPATLGSLGCAGSAGSHGG
jgi:hypothetical protein